MQFLGRLLEEVAAEELGLKKWEESQGGSHGYSVSGVLPANLSALFSDSYLPLQQTSDWDWSHQ